MNQQRRKSVVSGYLFLLLISAVYSFTNTSLEIKGILSTFVIIIESLFFLLFLYFVGRYNIKKLLKIAFLLSVGGIHYLMTRETVFLMMLMVAVIFTELDVNALTAYVVGKAAILENIPVVWHIREFMEEDLGISFIDSTYSFKLLNRATQFIAISQPICNKWSAWLQVPVTVVHDGVPVKDYYVAHNDTHETVKVLLYGRIVPGKGQLFYVRAAEKVLQNISVPCTFYFAGKVEDEDYFNKCMQSIQQSGQSSHIEYLGQISDIQSLLKDTDIVCVCSTKEGFGRVTVESMLGKCLVVGAASGATTELIQDGVNGILYQPDDEADFCKKLTACIEQFDKYAGVVENGQKYALSHFTDEKNTEGILLVYKDIAERIR